jgi:uncharacterized phiE125 gp8 family phage protein
MSLALKTAATALALDWTNEVKGHLRVDSDDEKARAEAILMPAASAWAETFTNRALITQTWTLYLDRFPGGCLPYQNWTGGQYSYIEIPKPPLQSITSIKYYDANGVLQTWSSSNYEVDPPAGAPFDPECQPYRVRPVVGQTWPIPRAQRGAVQIEFVCGYGAAYTSVPAKLKAAMLLVVGEQFERREQAVEGTIISKVILTAENLAWPFRVQLFAATDDQAYRYTDPYRLVGF